MADESKGGAPKKLSTKDILAAARAQASQGAAPTPPAPETPAPVAETPAPAAAAPETPAAAPKPAAGAKPKSTADILAAARAQKAAGAAPAADSPAKPAAAKPAAAPGAKPKSTADILAAARASKAGGTAPAASAEAAAPKASPKAAPAAAAAETDGPKLSVQEMLAAVRPGAEAAAPPKPAKPVAPPMPAKPVPSSAKKAAAVDESRRNILVGLLLSPFALAWTFFTATTAIASLAVARFMMPNVLTEPPRKFKIGPPTDYDLGTVATKLVAQYGVWIVHTDQYQSKNMIYALASVCTHLGCTPSWLEGEQKFKCPCHGSGFYITGINFEGPAPRPLERVGIRLSEDGMLEVDKSLKFQEEMGQWADPASFFEVVG
jgi:cytochrome b6-f complex iron-sulfur subunit